VKLIELLERHEGKTLEYKRDLSSPESVLKCLVAFANTGGGIVVIGVEDGSKNVRGVPDVLAAEEKLANLVSDSIRPRLVPDIEVVPWRNLPQQHASPLPGTAGTPRRRLHPGGLNQSKGGRAADRRTEMPKQDELFRRAGRSGPQVGSHRLPSCFRVVCPYRQMTAQAWTTLRIVTEHQGLTRESIIEGVRVAQIHAKREPSTFAAAPALAVGVASDAEVPPRRSSAIGNTISLLRAASQRTAGKTAN
jgi:ATP-dependent DNA helicase RecG